MYLFVDNSQILLLQSHRSVNINIGIEELKEILQKICCNQLTNVSQCRPSCLISYLKVNRKKLVVFESNVIKVGGMSHSHCDLKVMLLK